MRPWISELYKDVFLTLLVLGNWILTGLICDAFFSNEKLTKQGFTVWAVGFSAVINGGSFLRSFQSTGSKRAAPESLFGIWCEIVNLSQLWGVSFALARYAQLDDAHPFFQQTLLHNLAESVWEMGLVQAGVGHVAAIPTTLGERLVSWMAAYVGGVFATSMFFASVVLGERAYWNRQRPMEKTPLMPADTADTASSASDVWRVTLK